MRNLRVNNKVSVLTVLGAIRDQEFDAYEFLCESASSEDVEDTLEYLSDQGYTEFGCSFVRPWLTDIGWAYLESHKRS